MTEDTIRHAIIQFLDTLEAAIKSFRAQLLEAPVEPKPQSLPVEGDRGFDLEKIKWAETEGTNGPYLLALEIENRDNVDFEALYKHLLGQVGTKFYLGKWFIWKMDYSNSRAIGRKTMQRGQKQ